MAAADEHVAADSSLAYMALQFLQQPEPLYRVFREYAGSATTPAAHCPHSNFLKGVHWSPDGSCMLTASDDCWLRVYDLPQDALDVPATASTPADATNPTLLPGAASCTASASGDSFPAALRVQEGETIYDMAWYPGMTSTEPASCCFASSSRAHPIHLWDACTGALRCTYRGYNDVDEVTAAFSLAFSPSGQQLLAGYHKQMLVFDVTRPGRDCKKVITYRKRRQESLAGMVSCLAYAPESVNLVAAGSYGGDVALYDPRTWEMLYLLKGHKGGVTQVKFTSDGQFLITGGRQDPHLLCWDVRLQAGTTGELYRMQRDTGSTNQRVQFDIEPCGRHLLTGQCNGSVKVFDLQTGGAVDEFRVANDTVNGCSCHPYLPLLAVATGHRRYPIRSCRMGSDAGGDSSDESTSTTNSHDTDMGDMAEQPAGTSSRRDRGGGGGEACIRGTAAAAGVTGSAETTGLVGLASGAALAGQRLTPAEELHARLAKVRARCICPVRDDGTENVLRVMRMRYEMLQYAATDGEQQFESQQHEVHEVGQQPSGNQQLEEQQEVGHAAIALPAE